jgi:alanine dehydrogenase
VADDALQGERLATGLNVRRGRIVQPVVKNALGDLYA